MYSESVTESRKYPCHKKITVRLYLPFLHFFCLGWFSGHCCKLPHSTCISSFNPIFQQTLQAPINLRPSHSREAPVSFKHADEQRQMSSRLCLISIHYRVPCNSCVQWLLDEWERKRVKGQKEEGRRRRRSKEKKGEERSGKEGGKGVIEHPWINELVCFPHQYFCFFAGRFIAKGLQIHVLCKRFNNQERTRHSFTQHTFIKEYQCATIWGHTDEHTSQHSCPRAAYVLFAGADNKEPSQ